MTNQGRDGMILLFNAEDPVPVATWSVKKAMGGEVSFVETDSNFHHEKVSDEELPSLILVYFNGDHEYIVFDPYCREQNINQNHKKGSFPLEETGNVGYVSIYGELPQISSRMDETPLVPFAPSSKAWETIFSGSSHALPPLKKFSSTFLESWLEKITASQD